MDQADMNCMYVLPRNSGFLAFNMHDAKGARQTVLRCKILNYNNKRDGRRVCFCLQLCLFHLSYHSLKYLQDCHDNMCIICVHFLTSL